jgi:hypothetical protein
VAEEFWRGVGNRLLQLTECGKGALFTSQLYSRNMRAEIYTEMSEDVLEEIDQCVVPPAARFSPCHASPVTIIRASPPQTRLRGDAARLSRP